MNKKLLAMIASGLINPGLVSVAKSKKSKKSKKCLHCGKKHYHNNSFCSADCCKDYRANQQVENYNLGA